MKDIVELNYVFPIRFTMTTLVKNLWLEQGAVVFTRFLLQVIDWKFIALFLLKVSVTQTRRELSTNAIGLAPNLELRASRQN